MSAGPGRRWALWLSLIALAAWLAIFGDKTPAGAVAPRAAERQQSTPRAPAAPAAAARKSASRATALPPLEAPLPRAALLAPGATAHADADLFSIPPWMAPPPSVAPVAAPPAPPTPPRPDYRPIGKQHDGAAWEVFLAREDLSFIVREGQTLESVWRVDQIAPPTMSLTHVPSGQTHTLSIGEAR